MRVKINCCYAILLLFYFILFYFILFYFILFYFILFYFILFYFILFYLKYDNNRNVIMDMGTVTRLFGRLVNSFVMDFEAKFQPTVLLYTKMLEMLQYAIASNLMSLPVVPDLYGFISYVTIPLA
jgi:hypothetical protein